MWQGFWSTGKLFRIADILLCDTHHFDKSESLDTDPAEEFVQNGKHNFPNLEYLNLRGNQISQIDKAILLAPKVRTLLLGGNRVPVIENLLDLPELSILELSDNCIEEIDTDLHRKIGQLTRLDLANNKIKHLKGKTSFISTCVTLTVNFEGFNFKRY